MNQNRLCLDSGLEQTRTDVFTSYFPVSEMGGHQDWGDAGVTPGLLGMEGAAMPPAPLPHLPPPAPLLLFLPLLPFLPSLLLSILPLLHSFLLRLFSRALLLCWPSAPLLCLNHMHWRIKSWLRKSSQASFIKMHQEPERQKRAFWLWPPKSGHLKTWFKKCMLVVMKLLHICFLFLFFSTFIYLFIFGCVGSSLLHTGFL